ncbi:hypothetical protein [Paramagnetospirillum magneticum]|uniref:hypothetical protein n=1 Tax=Paramagnetospirillum magneticum TaxID=84159 RepID=UPI000302B6FF|nr:hypothetical protein [Paramagnetospirillum magneticum]
MTRSIMVAALLVGLAASPALAGGKKEGSGSGSGGESQGAMWSSLPGPREVVVAPPQISDSLGVVSVNATMWAGSGSAKCRVNFTVENYSSANVALGFVARTFGTKDEVVDNWVVTVATLPPNGRTGRLFSCTLGAVELMLIPTSGYDWPPAKCIKGAEEAEPCPLTLKINSTVPIILKKEEKKDDDKGKKDEKKSKH